MAFTYRLAMNLLGTILSVDSNGVSPSGKAQDFDSCIPWFESRHPSQFRR